MFVECFLEKNMERFHFDNDVSRKMKAYTAGAMLLTSAPSFADQSMSLEQLPENPKWEQVVDALQGDVYRGKKESKILLVVDGTNKDAQVQNIPIAYIRQGDVAAIDKERQLEYLQQAHISSDVFVCRGHTHNLSVIDPQEKYSNKEQAELSFIPQGPSGMDIFSDVKQREFYAEQLNISQEQVRSFVFSPGGVWYYHSLDMENSEDYIPKSDIGKRLKEAFSRRDILFETLMGYKPDGLETFDWMKILEGDVDVIYEKLMENNKTIPMDKSDIQEYVRFRDKVRILKEKSNILSAGVTMKMAQAMAHHDNEGSLDVNQVLQEAVDAYRILEHTEVRFVPMELVGQEPPCAGVDYGAQYEFRDGQWQQIP